MTAPAISVIIPAFNAAATLEQAVDSVLACARSSSIEALVIDDGSSDGTAALAQRLVRQDPQRVQALQHPGGRNKGVSASRNLGLRSARGRFIAFLDADDRYLANRFERCIPLLQEQAGIDGTFEAARVELDSPAERQWWGAGEIARMPQASSPAQLVDLLCFGHSWPISGITLRRGVFERSGGFNEKLPLSEDVELWLRVACVARLQGIDGEPVAIYRRHAGNRSKDTRRDEMLLLIRETIRWARRAGVASETVQQLRSAAVRYAIGIVDQARARGHAAEAARTLLNLVRMHPAALARRAFWANCLGTLRSAG